MRWQVHSWPSQSMTEFEECTGTPLKEIINCEDVHPWRRITVSAECFRGVAFRHVVYLRRTVVMCSAAPHGCFERCWAWLLGNSLDGSCHPDALDDLEDGGAADHEQEEPQQPRPHLHTSELKRAKQLVHDCSVGMQHFVLYYGLYRQKKILKSTGGSLSLQCSIIHLYQTEWREKRSQLLDWRKDN